MKLTFNKLGISPIFENDSSKPWSRSHAQVPVAVPVDENLRIFYATRDEHNQSRISFFDVDAGNPQEVVYRHEQIVLDIGVIGAFDDAGVMPTSAIWVNGLLYLYYIGWTLRQSVPFQNSVGLAVSDDGVNFRKAVPGPVLSTGPHDPYFVGTCWVHPQEGGYLAYYLSCNGWVSISDRYEPTYDIKLAESADGIEWRQSGAVVIANDEQDASIASASLFSVDDRKFLCYCSRRINGYREDANSSYKIRLAEEVSGKWEKSEGEFVTAGESGSWDEKMQAYPYIYPTDESLLMFYNGNGFGQSGIGVGRISS